MVQEYIVGNVDEYPEGTHKVVEIKGREIGVFNINHRFYAVPNLCPHQVGPLCTGKVSGTFVTNKETNWKQTWQKAGEIVTCPWHGLEFHVPTGQCLAFPIKLRTYEVVVENNEVKLLI